MTTVNPELFTVTENPASAINFDNTLIQVGNGNDYVFVNQQTVTDIAYDGVSLISLLWQNGNGFKDGDYNRPTTQLEIYPNSRLEHIFSDWGSQVDDDEKVELIDFFNDVMEKAGRSERFIEIDIDMLYQQMRGSAPDNPSEDVNDYCYDVDVIVWQQDENGKYPEVVDSKQGLTYSELRALQRDHRTEVTRIVAN